MSEASGKLRSMDDDTRRRLLRAVIGEDQPVRGRVRRWTLLEAAERASLVLNHTRRGLQELREQNPPLVWGDVDAGIGLGAVLGLALGIFVSVTTDVPFAPEAGLMLGALVGWFLRREGG